MLGFFILPPYAATGNRTHIGLVAPTRGTLIQHTLPTEQPRPQPDNQVGPPVYPEASSIEYPLSGALGPAWLAWYPVSAAWLGFKSVQQCYTTEAIFYSATPIS